MRLKNARSINIKKEIRFIDQIFVNKFKMI